MNVGRFVALGMASVFCCAGGDPAKAAANLVMNGSFSQTSLTSSGQIIGTSSVNGWNNAAQPNFSGYGYTFLAFPGTVDTTGLANNAGGTAILYGPGGGPGASNYSNNGLPATSPDGGNFIVADGDPSVSGPLTQTVTGLMAGQAYVLSFYWATAQMSPVGNSSTSEAWDVGFGNQSQNTQTLTTPYKGFNTWRQTTMSFTATSTSQLLSFLATGAPSGEPPTLLLDGVSLMAAPEPSSWAVLGGPILALGLGTHQNRRRKARKAGARVSAASV
jgi:hypothetical protein